MLKVIIMLGILFSITGCMKTKGLRLKSPAVFRLKAIARSEVPKEDTTKEGKEKDDKSSPGKVS